MKLSDEVKVWKEFAKGFNQLLWLNLLQALLLLLILAFG